MLPRCVALVVLLVEGLLLLPVSSYMCELPVADPSVISPSSNYTSASEYYFDDIDASTPPIQNPLAFLYPYESPGSASSSIPTIPSSSSLSTPLIKYYTCSTCGTGVRVGQPVWFEVWRSDHDPSLVTYTVDWGDGEFQQPEPVSSSSTAFNHVYKISGTITVTIYAKSSSTANSEVYGSVKLAVQPSDGCYHAQLEVLGTVPRQNSSSIATDEPTPWLSAPLSSTMEVIIRIGSPGDTARSSRLTKQFWQNGEIPSIAITNKTAVQLTSPTYDEQYDGWRFSLATNKYRGTVILDISWRGTLLLGCAVGGTSVSLVIGNLPTPLVSATETGAHYSTATALSRLQACNFQPQQLVVAQSPCSSHAIAVLLTANLAQQNSGCGGMILISEDLMGEDQTHLVDMTQLGNFTRIFTIALLEDHQLFMLTNTGLYLSLLDSGSTNVTKITTGSSVVDAGVDDNWSMRLASSDGHWCEVLSQYERTRPIQLKLRHSTTNQGILLQSNGPSYSQWDQITLPVVLPVPSSGTPASNSTSHVIIDAARMLASNHYVYLVGDANGTAARILTKATTSSSSSWAAAFVFPSDVKLTGMILSETGIELCAFGTEVWCSKDGGETFWLVTSLPESAVAQTMLTSRVHSNYALVTSGMSPTVYYGRVHVRDLLAVDQIQTTTRVLNTTGLRVLDTVVFDCLGNLVRVSIVSPSSHSGLLNADLFRGATFASSLPSTPFSRPGWLTRHRIPIDSLVFQYESIVPNVLVPMFVSDTSGVLSLTAVKISSASFPPTLTLPRNVFTVAGNRGHELSTINQTNHRVDITIKRVSEDGGNLEAYAPPSVQRSLLCTSSRCSSLYYSLRLSQMNSLFTGFNGLVTDTKQMVLGTVIGLELMSTNATTGGWSMVEVGMTVHACTGSIVVTSAVDTTWALGIVVQTLTCGINTTISTSDWQLFDFRSHDIVTSSLTQGLQIQSTSSQELLVTLASGGHIRWTQSHIGATIVIRTALCVAGNDAHCHYGVISSWVDSLNVKISKIVNTAVVVPATVSADEWYLATTAGDTWYA